MKFAQLLMVGSMALLVGCVQAGIALRDCEPQNILAVCGDSNPPVCVERPASGANCWVAGHEIISSGTNSAD